MGGQYIDDSFVRKMEVNPLVISFVAVFFTVLAGIVFSLCNATYRAYIKLGIPKVRTFFPFGSWYGVWEKVLGENDIENIKNYGPLHWGFDGKRANLFVAIPDHITAIVKNSSIGSFRANRVKVKMLSSSLEAIEKPETKETIFDEINIQKLIPRMERSAEFLLQELKNKEGNIHAQQVFMQYVGDVIAMTVFGVDLYSDDFKDKRSEFMEHLNQVFMVYNPTSWSSILPYVSKCFKTLDNSVLPVEAVSFFSDLCASIIEKKKEVVNNLETQTGDIDVIDLLLENQKKKSKPIGDLESVVEEIVSDDEIIEKCLSIILYTARATENSLSEAIYILSNVEDEQVKLYKEIQSSVGRMSEKSYGKQAVEAKYLAMFVKELHRMYPIEYRLVRDCDEGIKLGDYNLPPNISLTVPIYAVHHSSEFFPEPFSFKPDRFSPENLKEIHSGTYMPFGNATTNPTFVGCRLMDMFTKVALTYMLANFKVSLPVPHFQAPLNYVKGATEIPVLMPVMFQLEKRD